MATIERFEDITAWQKARQLTQQIYAASNHAEFARDYPLRDQIRRAALSIPSNIAEGFERDGDKEFLQFLSIAKGSCGEVRAHLYVALDQAYLTEDRFRQLTELAEETSRLLARFIHYLRDSSKRGWKFNPVFSPASDA